MKKKNNINKKLVHLKLNAFQLKEGGQLPSFIFSEIARLGVNSSADDIAFLMSLSEQALRIKGFYFKFPEIAESYRIKLEEYKKERRK